MRPSTGAPSAAGSAANAAVALHSAAASGAPAVPAPAPAVSSPAAATATMADAASPNIRRLSERTTHDLRAAVVLAEPSQAVHEIVANALDAGAQHISIVVDFSQLHFTVSDDGRGMRLADLRRIGQRHVTSKVRQTAGIGNSSSSSSSSAIGDELAAASARTIGWRGEALSSLAQLAVLDIQTRPYHDDLSSSSTAETTSSSSSSSSTKRRHSGAVAAAASPSAASSPSAATYCKLLAHGKELFCGFSALPRTQAGTTVSLRDLYARMPVRARLLSEDKSRGRERDKLKKRIMRLALVHPQVEFALYDATMGPVAQAKAARNKNAIASKHPFPLSPAAAMSATAAASNDGSAPSAAASTGGSHHLPVMQSQRIWFKPRTGTLLENFHAIFGSGAATSSSTRNARGGGGAFGSPDLSFPLSPSLSLSPGIGTLFSLEHRDLSSSLVELRPFKPSVPAQTTPSTTAFLKSMRVSGFLSHPARLLLQHRDMQFLFVNRHFVVHKPLARAVEAMYERVAKFIPAVAAAIGGSGSQDTTSSPRPPHSSPSVAAAAGGGSSALQRGSIKTRSGVAPPPSAKQGRRRHPVFLLHLELAPEQYDLLFDPDKSNVQFASAWAATDGVTQALRRWLFALFPALAMQDAAIFPPTYMPQWLSKRSEEDEEEARLMATMDNESPSPSPTPPTPLQSSSPFVHLQRSPAPCLSAATESKEQEDMALPSSTPAATDTVGPATAVEKVSRTPAQRTTASFTRNLARSVNAFIAERAISSQPASPAAAAVATTSSPQRSPAVRASETTTEEAAPTAVTAAAAPADASGDHTSAAATTTPAGASLSSSRLSSPRLSFQSVFSHPMRGIASSGNVTRTRAPSTFLAAPLPPISPVKRSPAPVAHRPSATTSSPSSPATAIGTASPRHPPRPRRLSDVLASSSSSAATAVAQQARSSALAIAQRNLLLEPMFEHVQPQQWSTDAAASTTTTPMAATAEEEDGAAEWTGSGDGVDEAEQRSRAAPILDPFAYPARGSSKHIRGSVPSKERPADTTGEGAATDAASISDQGQSFADTALFMDFEPPQPPSSPSRRVLQAQSSPLASPSKQAVPSSPLVAAASTMTHRSAESFAASGSVGRRSSSGRKRLHGELEAEPSPSATPMPSLAAVQPTDALLPLSKRPRTVDEQAACTCPHAAHDISSSSCTTAPALVFEALPTTGQSMPARTPSPPAPDASAWPPGSAPSSTSAQLHPIALERDMLLRAELVGQLDNKFLVCRVEGLLLAVDQHAADERRRLEFLQQRLTLYVQQVSLLQALPLPISSAEESVLRSHEAEICAWGFRFRFPGALSSASASSSSRDAASRSAALVSNRVLLTSVPLVCGVELDVEDLREYLQQLRDTKPLVPTATSKLNATAASDALASPPSPLTGFLSRTPLPVQRILNYKACRSSVMFGDTLPLASMRAILRGLRQCDFPFNCAHGRPTMTPLVHVQPLQRQADEDKQKRGSGEDAAAIWTAEDHASLLDLLTPAH